jgi:hypothetical protein
MSDNSVVVAVYNTHTEAEKDSVLEYEQALKSDKFLLVAHGTADEAAKARDIIRVTRPAAMDVHACVPLTHAGAAAI